MKDQSQYDIQAENKQHKVFALLVDEGLKATFLYSLNQKG